MPDWLQHSFVSRSWKQKRVQSQKRVVKLNDAFWVSDRPTCLTFFCSKMSKNAEWINKECCFFIRLDWRTVSPYCRAAFIWLMQRYNANTPKSKFFGLLISHFESFPHPKIGIHPLIYGLSRAFSTREKKMKSGYNMLSHADSQNVRSSNVWPPQNVTALTHIFATEPQKALTANTMNVCSEGFWFAGTKCPFQWSHLNFYEFQDLP